jgi:hypothetical protein
VVHELIQEVEYSVGLWAGDWLDFDPLGDLSMATKALLNPLGAVGRGPIMSSPQQAKGMVGGMVTRL